jgi:hypothetical protein
VNDTDIRSGADNTEHHCSAVKATICLIDEPSWKLFKLGIATDRRIGNEHVLPKGKQAVC